MPAPMLQGEDKDNGLIPVRLGQQYKNCYGGETAGYEREEVDHILKHDKKAEELVKMQAVKDGPKGQKIGKFKAVSKKDVKATQKLGYKVCGQSEEKEIKKPAKPE